MSVYINIGINVTTVITNSRRNLPDICNFVWTLYFLVYPYLPWFKLYVYIPNWSTSIVSMFNAIYFILVKGLFWLNLMITWDTSE